MAVNTLVKRIQDIMRKDSGVDGDAQRISQMTWMFFLKVYDAKEQEWEIFERGYKSIIPEDLKWRNWAVDDHGPDVLTGEKLIDMVNNRLFPTLKNLEITPETPLKQRIVKYVFEDSNNYMKDGVFLRQVINVINEIDFSEYKDRYSEDSSRDTDHVSSECIS